MFMNLIHISPLQGFWVEVFPFYKHITPNGVCKSQMISELVEVKTSKHLSPFS